ncbi:dihydrofolate reductase [Pontibacillus halophilus JSM 076056 = DSM 19796]|uniref:Dihydrofolate reductase n=1 Tax=Pontibacillus halophilus JSM 076056 = DSM 19796 TaxID=1385510 RepID=A0A0A5IBA7_9BACI|nr:dipicolinate synthase subunit B [Pontibacillus halophilus]KGX93122.1 dihydrofolate reductase [Pontibacillus halophilus JSM 076056 = DSM 19796]
MWENKTIGFGLTGSHCTYADVFPQVQEFIDLGATVVPVVSYTVQKTDTRFGDATEHLLKLEEITGEKLITTIPDAEPLGPKRPLDCMIIAPLTGNSMSKMANALTDSPVLMAAKATLRNQKPVVVGISTNDALGLNGVNLMRLMATKNIFFVPYGQDDPVKKPNSMVADMSLLTRTVEAALEYKQVQPVIIERT